MDIFARTYARRLPSLAPAQPDASDQGEPARRVRIASGTLAGLTGRVISSSDPERWLIQADLRGVLLRVSPQILEPLPPD